MASKELNKGPKDTLNRRHFQPFFDDLQDASRHTPQILVGHELTLQFQTRLRAVHYQQAPPKCQKLHVLVKSNGNLLLIGSMTLSITRESSLCKTKWHSSRTKLLMKMKIPLIKYPKAEELFFSGTDLKVHISLIRNKNVKINLN